MEKELLDNHLLTLDCEFGRYFTPSQISAIKEVIRYGAWGDADQEYLLGLDAINKRIFSSPKYSYGYITNDVTAESEIYTNNKVFSGVISGISKILSKGCPFMVYLKDYWSDGKADLLFINVEYFNKYFDNYSEIIKAWANNKNN